LEINYKSNLSLCDLYPRCGVHISGQFDGLTDLNRWYFVLKRVGIYNILNLPKLAR